MKIYELMAPDYKEILKQKISIMTPQGIKPLPVEVEKTYACLIENEDIENGVVSMVLENSKWQASFLPVMGLEVEADSADIALISLGLKISNLINRGDCLFSGRDLFAEYFLALSKNGKPAGRTEGLNL